MGAKVLALAGGFAISTMMTVVAAQAHHSFAMFDSTQTVVIDGTVREFQYTNPHSWLTVAVMREGKVEEWSLEMGAVNMLFKLGVRRDSFNVGDKISVRINPLKTGTPGGHAIEVISINGMPPPDNIHHIQ